MAEIVGPDGRPIPRPQLGTEVATVRHGRDITRGYVDGLFYLSPQDRVLRYQGAGAYEIYEQLLQDDRVYATLAQRRAAVVARDTEVIPGGTMRRDKMAADFIRDTLDHIRWDTVTERMLYGVFYGYSVAEAIWMRDGRHIALDRLKVRNRRRFVFDVDFNLLLLTTHNTLGEPLPPNKFWVFATGADHDDEPYGRGLAHYLYWPVWFKKNQIKFWLVFLEKFGMPTVTGKYQRNATPDERRKLHQALEAVHADAAVSMPADMEIMLLEASRSGSVSYEKFYQQMQAAITTVILSQTMTTDDGSSLAQATVHMDVRKELVEADADLVCDSFNRSIATWLTAWNFPGAAIPRVRRNMPDTEELKALAERDKLIVDMGHRLDADYIEETYGVTVDRTAPPPAPAPGPEFAEGDEDGPGVLADRLAEDANPLMDGLIEPIRQIVEEASSLEEVRDRLLDAYPDMDVSGFAALMQRALAAAELAGDYDASEKTEEGQ